MKIFIHGLKFLVYQLIWFIFVKGQKYEVIKNRAVSGVEYLYQSIINLNKVRCLARCLPIEQCNLVSHDSNQRCNLYYIAAYDKVVYSINSAVFIKESKYKSYFMDGLTNYWIVSSNTDDLISKADLFNGNNVKSATNKDGKSNSAFSFTNGSYQAPNGVYFSGDFTVSAWARVSTFQRHQRLIDFGVIKNDNVIIGLNHLTTTNIHLTIHNGDLSKVVASNYQLRIGIWEHITCVLNGTKGSIYINGELDNSGTLYIPNNIVRTSNLIGQSNWRIDGQSDSSISNIKIFKRALTPSEIISNMNNN